MHPQAGKALAAQGRPRAARGGVCSRLFIESLRVVPLGGVRKVRTTRKEIQKKNNGNSQDDSADVTAAMQAVMLPPNRNHDGLQGLCKVLLINIRGLQGLVRWRAYEVACSLRRGR